MDASYTNLSQRYSSKPDDYYELSRAEMVSFVPETSRSILEVGCSSGAFGALLKERGPGVTVWGIEPDADSAGVATGRLDRVITGTFSADMPELDGKHFDAICFNDVLEHLANPEEVLTGCRNLLDPGGVVVASIPNILFFYQISKILIEQDWKYEEFGIMDNTHLRFFTRKSIVRMFETTGYDIEKIEGINAFAGKKYKIANFLTLGRLSDWKYVQFGITARVRP